MHVLWSSKGKSAGATTDHCPPFAQNYSQYHHSTATEYLKLLEKNHEMATMKDILQVMPSSATCREKEMLLEFTNQL
jgi:predicted transcriptional regulator